MCVIQVTGQDIIISEISPANASYTHGEDTDETPDWIELQNISTSACNLSEYSVATKETFATPFQLPSVSIPTPNL